MLSQQNIYSSSTMRPEILWVEHFPQAYSEPQMLLVEDPPGRDQTPQPPKVVEKKRGDFLADLVEMRWDWNLIWSNDWIGYLSSCRAGRTYFARLLRHSVGIICISWRLVCHPVWWSSVFLFLWRLFDGQPQWTRCDPDVLILFHLYGC